LPLRHVSVSVTKSYEASLPPNLKLDKVSKKKGASINRAQIPEWCHSSAGSRWGPWVKGS